MVLLGPLTEESVKTILLTINRHYLQDNCVHMV